ncbi:MAG: short-chain dehydrogenase, partial [Bacteroidetes bacterium]
MLAARNPERLAADASDLNLRYNTEVQVLGIDILQTESFASVYASLNPQPDVVCMMVGLLGEHAAAEADSGKAKLLMDSNYTGPSLFLLEAAR